MTTTAPLWESGRRSHIRSAVSGDALTSVFQPIVDLSTGDEAGYEALTRFDVGWDTRGPRNPRQWFAEAHRFGLGRDLEVAAVRSAIEAFDAPGSQTVVNSSFLAINASPSVVGCGELEAAIRGLDPSRLVIEVTEHDPIRSYTSFLSDFSRLKRLGVRLAVDDAGAGHATLQRIVQLVPDLIKIDMSLTRSIDRDPARQAMVSALIAFGADTGAAVIAEGVETVEEAETLRALGASYGQGFHLGRPAPLAHPQP